MLLTTALALLSEGFGARAKFIDIFNIIALGLILFLIFAYLYFRYPAR